MIKDFEVYFDIFFAEFNKLDYQFIKKGHN